MFCFIAHCLLNISECNPHGVLGCTFTEQIKPIYNLHQLNTDYKQKISVIMFIIKIMNINEDQLYEDFFWGRVKYPLN